jgi:hypothetical protein
VWSLYRDKGITLHWKPAPKLETTVGKKPDAAKKVTVAEPLAGPPQRPAGRPAGDDALRDFLRRILFTVSPGRMKSQAVKAAPTVGGRPTPKVAVARQRPIPARKAKLALVEALRDLAVEDAAFAAVIEPLFEEFSASRGASERAACLVALIRIAAARKAAPQPSKDAA